MAGPEFWGSRLRGCGTSASGRIHVRPKQKGPSSPLSAGQIASEWFARHKWKGQLRRPFLNFFTNFGGLISKKSDERKKQHKNEKQNQRLHRSQRRGCCSFLVRHCGFYLGF